MRILIAGDFAPRNRVAASVNQESYDALFPDNLVRLIRFADYSIVNLECPITDANDKPISKCGPNLKCTKKVIDAIQYAGFKAVTMANNHILDYGSSAMNRSVSMCEAAGLDVVGVGQSLDDAKRILYKQVQGQSIAIINCCEHEFSLATDNSPGANPLNPIRQYYSISEAKSKADYVLVIVHGGHEHWQLPSPRMQETYRFFIDVGADAVVNHHQHCYSGYEMYNGKPIFYGLGNFCFDIDPIRVDDLWNYGYIVELEFGEKIDFQIYPYKQCSNEVAVSLLHKDSFATTLDTINAIIADTKLLRIKTNEYYESSQDSVRSFIEPIQNRWILAAQRRKLLPSLVFRTWTIKMYNLIFCEAHRDKLLYFLDKKLGR